MLVLDITVVVMGLFYVLIGRYTNEKNAKHLFAGYREMSELEREKYDIKAILKFFKPFIKYLGIYSILFYFLISFLFDYSIAMLVWIVSHAILLPYLVIKLNKFNIEIKN